MCNYSNMKIGGLTDVYIVGAFVSQGINNNFHRSK